MSDSPIGAFDPGAAAAWTYGPMTFSQVLDRIFRLMRKHYRSFLGIASLPIGSFFVLYLAMIVPMALSGAFSRPPVSRAPRAFVAMELPAMMLFGVSFMAIYSIYCAAASYAALQADLGADVGVRAAYRQAISRTGRYIWLMILRTLYVGLPLLAAAAILAVGALVIHWTGAFHDHPLDMFLLIPLGILSYIGAFAWAIVTSLRLSLAIPACVTEGSTASEALRRSGRLTAGAKGRIFLVLLIVYAATYVAFLLFIAAFFALAAIGGLLVTALHAPTGLKWILAGGAAIVAAGGLFLFMATTYASYAAAFAVLYHDRRRHGF